MDKEDEVLSEKGKFHKITFKKKVKSAKNVIIKGKNFEIICSKNHRFPTMEGLKKAEELSLKDKLLRYDEYVELESGLILDSSSKQFFGIDGLQSIAKQKFIKLKPVKRIKKLPGFLYHKNRFRTTLNQEIRIPADLDKDLMELIGIILGDGNLSRNRVRVINADREIIRFVTQVFKEKFGLTPFGRRAGRSKICKEISVNSVVLTSFLEHLELRGNVSTKRVPEICFWRSDEEIGSLLRGLFDTDGNIILNRRKDHIISVCFSNKELINDVLLLLAKIGIVGKLNKLRGNKRICITGSRNIELFRKLVGFRIKRKQKLLLCPVKNTNKPSIGEKIISVKEASRTDKHYLYQGKEFVRTRSDVREPYLFIQSYEKDVQSIEIEKIEMEKNPRVFYDITVNSPSHQFVLKNGVISHNSNFINSSLNAGDVRSMCCRLRLNLRELDRNITGGLFGSGDSTGSIGVVSINMSRVGYLSKDRDEFFKRLEYMMTLAKTSLEIKREIVKRNMQGGLLPYTKRYLGTLRNHFSTIGPVGMNEACLNLLGEDISGKEGRDFTLRTLNFMREKLQDFQEETGHIYNLEAVPAEGTSYRLSRIDKRKYPDIITAGKGTPYYTNSTLLPVDKTKDVIEALEHQEALQTLYTGGTVFHIFLGERMSSGESCKRLLKKVVHNTRIPYFTITPTYSICPDHGYLRGEHSVCPKCGKEAEVYSRVVGYFRPVKNWNQGKQEEFKQRVEYKVAS
ncbi:MAG: anaerobic ribonucleoside-triphosphate reductase [Candidatus Aerophobetes bacterium]|nr:anaerobic ribonucleoside-triphosphate reductase [Candidatus Aerophobetes bacterium]